VLHLLAARGFHDVEAADDVGVDVGARVLDAVAHAGLGGQVDDGAGPGGGDGGLQGGVVFQQGFGGGELGVLAQQGVAGLLQAHVVVVGHAVVAVDGVALVEQQLGQVKADEAGGAGDEIAHGRGLRVFDLLY